MIIQKPLGIVVLYIFYGTLFSRMSGKVRTPRTRVERSYFTVIKMSYAKTYCANVRAEKARAGPPIDPLATG